MEGISIAKLLVIGALIVLLFGTNKLRSLGGDLGAAIKGFKKAMNDDQPAAKSSAQDEHPTAISETRPKE
ncbi:twin-arginine translocase subunit TatE [Dickeya oryzae]|uniref:twin-arginine translocase subunit TatE n=1 Tax=Dickeya oryzae TaxID=1240404 RepID=UPI001AECE31A|nr:twin-arginine translocase subunit TatE [Dickeya oryzae]MBP2844870.1 twin-arginine translocase subunit TatE [Dickeya oryzae]